ncbi:DUF4270 family protein [Spirosoma arcticum]
MLPYAITTSTRNWLGRLCLLAGTVAGVLACEEPKEIGLPPTTPVEISYSDTLRAFRSTVLLDSVRTYNTSQLLIGSYTDPYFGNVKASAYAQLTLAGVPFTVQDADKKDIPTARIIYDSTRLITGYSGYFYGDTLKTQELQVYRLTEAIDAAKNYDINSSVAYASEPLLRASIQPRPITQDSTRGLRLRLPDAFGRELLALANTDTGKTQALFQAKMKGLAFRTALVSNAALFGIVPNSFVGVYYHVEGETTARLRDFSFEAGRFNQILSDRTGTALAGLAANQELSATALKGQSVIQSTAGVTTKLMFPGLDQLRKNSRVAINRADLIITPKPTTDNRYSLPFYLALSEVTAQNRILRTNPSRLVQLVPQSQTLFDRAEGSFNTPQAAPYDARTKSYTFELSGYFQSILSGLTPNNGLAIVTASSPQLGISQNSPSPDYFMTDRVFQAVLDGDASVKLVVFYTTSK